MWPAVVLRRTPALRQLAGRSHARLVPPSNGIRAFASGASKPPAAPASHGIAKLCAAAAFSFTVYSWLGQPVNLEAPPPAATITEENGKEGAFYSDPTTGVVFPKRSALLQENIPTGHGDVAPPELDLLGTGIRAVTFLRVRIYVAGFYTDTTAATKVIRSAGLSDDAPLDQIVAALVDAGTPVAIRIVPTRTVDFSHLRDGLLRAADGHLKKLKSASPDQGAVDPTEEIHASQDLAVFKGLFARSTKAQKYHSLDLLFHRITSDGRPATGLTLAHDGAVLGTVVPTAKVNPITQNLVLAYFADGKVPSPPVRSLSLLLIDCVNICGCINSFGRPWATHSTTSGLWLDHQCLWGSGSLRPGKYTSACQKMHGATVCFSVTISG